MIGIMMMVRNDNNTKTYEWDCGFFHRVRVLVCVRASVFFPFVKISSACVGVKLQWNIYVNDEQEHKRKIPTIFSFYSSVFFTVYFHRVSHSYEFDIGFLIRQISPHAFWKVTEKRATELSVTREKEATIERKQKQKKQQK